MSDLNKIPYLPVSRGDNVKQIKPKDSKELQKSKRKKELLSEELKKTSGKIFSNASDPDELTYKPPEPLNSIEKYSYNKSYKNPKDLRVGLEDGRILRFDDSYFSVQRIGLPVDISGFPRDMTPEELKILINFVDAKIENSDTKESEKQDFVDLKSFMKTVLEEEGLNSPYISGLDPGITGVEPSIIRQASYENGKHYRFEYEAKLPKDVKSPADKFSLYNVNPITFRESKLKLSKAEIGKYIARMEDSIRKMQRRHQHEYPRMVDLLEKMKQDFVKIKYT